MKQLNKAEQMLFVMGGALMVAGIMLFVFSVYPSITSWVAFIGMILFAFIQMKQTYEGRDLVIKRLRRIMHIAEAGFVLTGFFLVENHFHFLLPLFSNSIGDYATYVNVFHNNWVVVLLIAVVLEVYTTFRIERELKRQG